MGEKPQWTPTQPQARLASPENPDHTRMVPDVWTRYINVLPSMCLCWASEGPQMHALV